MAKPKRIDISNELQPPGKTPSVDVNTPSSVPAEKKQWFAKLSQKKSAPNDVVDDVKQVVEDKANVNVPTIRKPALPNALSENLGAAENGVQKAKSVASGVKVPKNIPKAAKGQQAQDKPSGGFTNLLGKLKKPRVLLVIGGLLLAALSGTAGYVLGLNDPRLARHSEDLDLPPISFESFASSTTNSTNSIGASIDLSKIPPYEFYDWPVQDVGRVSSCFGGRQILGVANFHKGLDIAVSEGTPVMASKTGIVERFRVRADAMGYGTFVLLMHADGMRTLYAHLLPELSLQLGQTVKQGEVFAHSGNTGHSTGPHLHFEVISPDAQAINPAQFLENRLEAPLYSSLDEPCWYRDLLALQR